MRLSLRARLLLLTAGLLLTGLAVSGTVVLDQLERYQLSRTDTQLRSFATIMSQVTPQRPPGDGAARPDLLDSALDLLGTPYVVFLSPDGKVVNGILSSRVSRVTLPDGLRTVPADGIGVSLPAADGSGRWRAVARPAAGGAGTVIAAAPLTEADATLARVRTVALTSGGLLLALLTVAGWFALGRGLRPLRRIEHTAAAIAGGDLAQRVPDAAPRTEIGRLAISLNTMLGQLERAFAEQAAAEARMRAFVSDVSHELRTPLFVIKGSTELYRMGGLTGPDAAADAVAEAMHGIDREAGRLSALTEDLLLLARLDETPDGQLDQGPMDLRTLATDARHDLRALDPTRPVTLTGPGGGRPGPAPVHADEARLRQVVTNLVGNAAAHTPAGTPVRIGVGTVGDRAVLEIADDGPGMTAEQAGRVFDRFYRADRSRSREGGANAGLGLAIARSLAQAHGGEIELTTAIGKGAVFRISLPLLAG
ncbi:HAMP domain-containing sensor histidine kinase [Actinoplanes sp. NBRC 103695]|uniref:sensor histidine kinase n=1 Tax=Actinoplanes sp. NBRC 103695 TaxID=3032202 RepID=UPI0024A50EC9|nr:HAMP domain-containing sensor histidine kinase [Actinoplanes sp. NBRC 103695]GLZ01843.1 two-component sensor histidine kinase [Actinoplanes sp. NBRC 103695]